MDTELKDKILSDYPLPIAVYYCKMIKEEHRTKKKPARYQNLFFDLIDLFEITNKFLAVLVLADYVKAGAYSEPHNKRIYQKFQKKNVLRRLEGDS